MAKVLNIDEAIALHKGNAEFYKETGEEIMMQNERNLVNWLTEAKNLEEAIHEAMVKDLVRIEPMASEIDFAQYRYVMQRNLSNAVVKLCEDSDKDKRQGGFDENGNKEIHR